MVVLCGCAAIIQIDDLLITGFVTACEPINTPNGGGVGSKSLDVQGFLGNV